MMTEQKLPKKKRGWRSLLLLAFSVWCLASLSATGYFLLRSHTVRKYGGEHVSSQLPGFLADYFQSPMKWPNGADILWIRRAVNGSQTSYYRAQGSISYEESPGQPDVIITPLLGKIEGISIRVILPNFSVHLCSQDIPTTQALQLLKPLISRAEELKSR